MHFRPETTNTIEGRTAIELWDGDRRAATVYAQRAGLHIVFDPPYGVAPRSIAIEVQEPTGIQIGITTLD